MKFKTFHSQPDPHVSFLDVSLCLLVVFCLLFCAAIVQTRNSASKNAKENLSIKLEAQKEKYESKLKQQNDLDKKKMKDFVEKTYIDFQQKEEEICHTREQLKTQKMKNMMLSNPNRYRGRGGQPSLPIVVKFEDGEYYFDMGSRSYTWPQFRKIICNMDRREEYGNPALIFSIQFEEKARDLQNEQVLSYFGDHVHSLKQYDIKHIPFNYLVFTLLKIKYRNLENRCRKFKAQHTTEIIGNWDGDIVGDRSYTEYNTRKEYGRPYLWFTVDNEERRIILGPPTCPLSMLPFEFVDLLGAIKGGDGFYVEYRDPDSLEYNPEVKIPDWVVKCVLEPAGYGKISDL